MKLYIIEKPFIENIVSRIYYKIFQENISSEVTKFFKNLSHVAIGTIIGTLFSFIYDVSAGRFLGPSEYGKFTLVNSVAMFLYIPMLLGICNGMIKYNSAEKDVNKQKNIISTTYIMAFIFTITSVLIYILFSDEISSIFRISKEIYQVSVIFAILFVFYRLTNSTLQSLNEMKIYSLLKPIYGVILLGSFLFFISKNLSYTSMIYSMYLAYGIAGITIIYIIRKSLRLKFDIGYAKLSMKYSFFTLLSGISYILYSHIDKILISKYMPIENVGLYHAYNFSSVSTITVLSGIFMSVFFPTISKYKDKRIIIKRVNKFVPYLICLGIPFTLISEYIILHLYGEEYPLDLFLMIAFAVISVLNIWYSTYGWIYNSIGVKGAAAALLGTASISITNIILNMYLIPIFGLQGAVGATVVAHIVGILVSYLQKNKLIYAE